MCVLERALIAAPSVACSGQSPRACQGDRDQQSPASRQPVTRQPVASPAQPSPPPKKHVQTSSADPSKNTAYSGTPLHTTSSPRLVLHSFVPDPPRTRPGPRPRTYRQISPPIARHAPPPNNVLGDPATTHTSPFSALARPFRTPRSSARDASPRETTHPCNSTSDYINTATTRDTHRPPLTPSPRPDPPSLAPAPRPSNSRPPRPP